MPAGEHYMYTVCRSLLTVCIVWLFMCTENYGAIPNQSTSLHYKPFVIIYKPGGNVLGDE